MSACSDPLFAENTLESSRQAVDAIFWDAEKRSAYRAAGGAGVAAALSTAAFYAAERMDAGWPDRVIQSGAGAIGSLAILTLGGVGVSRIMAHGERRQNTI